MAFSPRNQRRLKYVIAIIVFLTFISREVLHDRYRDLADEIDRTEQTISIRQDINSATREIRSS